MSANLHGVSLLMIMSTVACHRHQTAVQAPPSMLRHHFSDGNKLRAAHPTSNSGSIDEIVGKCGRLRAAHPARWDGSRNARLARRARHASRQLHGVEKGPNSYGVIVPAR